MADGARTERRGRSQRRQRRGWLQELRNLQHGHAALSPRRSTTNFLHMLGFAAAIGLSLIFLFDGVG